MKIIGVRRGFSTNCSGANEYFPPSPVLPPPNEDAGPSPWKLDPNAKVVFRWVTLMPDGSLPPTLKKALHSDDAGGETGPINTTDADVDVDGAEVAPTFARSDDAHDGEDGAEVSQSPFRGAGGIGLILFAVLLSVLALLGVERLIRSLTRKRERRSHDDSRT